jgi:maltooligosyltrehalose trehalohydrolase
LREIRVWAPRAGAVDLVIGDDRTAMRAEEGGWWSAAGSEAGGDYAFLLDGEGPFPDPRSPWQPSGVHGPSRPVDHGSFRWSDRGWSAGPLRDAIFYELHVGTFTSGGTFDAVVEKLDHLVDLGVTHVELMPVAEFPGARGWGYDGVDLFAPHHAYGGPEGLKRLVDACHGRGLAVVLDVVYNHLGPVGNYLERFGPYHTHRYETPWGPAVNLDGEGSDEVRRFFFDNAATWLRDYHLDGLRIDAVHAIFDLSAVHFLEEMTSVVSGLESSLGRRLVLIAESDLNDPRLIRAPQVGGYGMDAQWSDDFHHAVHAHLTGERNGYYADFGPLAEVARALERGYVYDGRYSVYRGRRHGRPAAGLSGHRFVSFLQNHDQVGNRAWGERLVGLVGHEAARAASALLFGSAFVPLLFQGEEWGASSPFPYFTDFDDPEVGRSVREGRREEFAAFGWNEIPDPQSAGTFEGARLDWSEPEREPHRETLAWTRDLIRLRRELPELRDGDLGRVRVRFDEESRWFSLLRGPVAVACNFSDRPGEVLLPAPRDAGHGEERSSSPGRRAPAVLLASESGVEARTGSVDLPPRSAAVLRLEPETS